MTKDLILDRRDERVNYFVGPSQWTGQFDDAYKPWRNRNYEVPKAFKAGTKITRPLKILVNDYGQFKVGVTKNRKNLWGNYVATWSYPKKITREWADRSSGVSRLFPETLDNCKKKPLIAKTSGDIKLIEEKKKGKEENDLLETPIEKSKNEELISKIEGKTDSFCPIHDI